MEEESASERLSEPIAWRIERRVLCMPARDKGKVRYLLQEKRFDAPSPYWLTYRIYRLRGQAEFSLKKLLRGEKI